MSKKLISIKFIFLAAILLASNFATTVQAFEKKFDEDFYSSNDILYYNPDAVACSVIAGSGGAANIDVAKDFSLGGDNGQRAVNLVKALMKDFGFTAEQASGVVGNFMHESGGSHLPPDFNENSRSGEPPRFAGGYGWAQWTGGRQVAFIKFAVDNGFMGSKDEHATDAANYAYLKHELINTAEKTAVEKVKATSSTDDAVVAFEAAFERAGKPMLDERKQQAKAVFSALNGGSVAVSDNSSSSGSSATSCPSSSGGSGLVGDKAFPLKATKDIMDKKNPGLFKDGTTGKSGHPYTAYDILADTGTEVTALMGGTVTLITQDKCPGRMISIFNKEANVTISYLHMSMNPGTHVAKGDIVQPGQHVGQVGTTAEGCNTPHLHIDAAQGDTRPGCARENCPAANASKFIDIGADLYKTYEALP